MARFDKLEFEHQTSQHSLHEESTSSRAFQDRDWTLRADEMRRNGSFEEALRYYSRALEDDKSLLVCWVGQVQMLIHLGEYPEAALWGQKSLELFPNNSELLAASAQALCRNNKMRAAHSSIDQAMQQPGQSAYRWIVRGELLLVGKQPTHRHCFDRSLQCDDDWLTPLELGLIYRHYRQPNNALLQIRTAIERDPSVPYLWYTQARCQLDLGMTHPAQKSLRNCLELKPDYRDAEDLFNCTRNGNSFWRRIRSFWKN